MGIPRLNAAGIDRIAAAIRAANLPDPPDPRDARIAELLAQRERLQRVLQRLVDGWGDPRSLCKWADANLLSDRAAIMAVAAAWAALEPGDLKETPDGAQEG